MLAWTSGLLRAEYFLSHEKGYLARKTIGKIPATYKTVYQNSVIDKNI